LQPRHAGVIRAVDEFVLACELGEFFRTDGRKWIVCKPPAEWFAARPRLPAVCLQGNTEHLVGTLAWE
jgi:hypothetical protein